MASAGHLLTVTALLLFILMLYDSIRQNKPAIRNNFGVGRFSTRLNFYFFEISRLSFTQRKSFFLARYDLASLHTNSSGSSKKDRVSNSSFVGFNVTLVQIFLNRLCMFILDLILISWL